jgi:hypothetical protein
MILLPLSLAGEQIVRGWKWRQLLLAIKPIRTLRLFGAIMAGYFVNFMVPLGVSALVRSWLVARMESLPMGQVLATAAIDRLVDGIVFTGFVALALAFAVFPDPDGNIRAGLIAGGGGSLFLFTVLLIVFARWKRQGGGGGGRLAWLVSRLPKRLTGPVDQFLLSFTDGIVWPAGLWRGAGIVTASIAIKSISASHFLWAGLAFGVLLDPVDYIFLMVFLGFLLILTRFARIPGGMFVGNIFVLDLLGVGEEQALAMVILVQTSVLVTISAIGFFALWRNGITIGELRAIRPQGGQEGR